MSKNLIINKLNKCKAFQFNQYDHNKHATISKFSTSNKTQQSPQLHQLNPQFTFKASDIKKILPSKTKINQFFDNFNPDEQVVYQKVVLIKPKVIQRSLEFQLMNLYRQGQKKSQQTAIKKLNFSDDQDVETNRTSLQKKIKVQQGEEKFYGAMKTEYLQSRDSERYFKPGNKDYFENNMPYDCKKYKLQRDKQCNKSKQMFVRQQIKRCHTQAQAENYEPIPSYLSNAYYETINNSSKPFNDYNFKSLQLKQNQQNFFNQYYFNNQTIQSKQQDHRSKLMKKSETTEVQLTKRSGNSSRLSFFRKERDYQMRKSLLEEYNQSKRNNFCSFDNKENVKSSSKFIPSVAMKNPLQPEKRLQSQFSQRQLLDKRYVQQNIPNKKFSHYIPKSSITFMNKETELRIHSIRKQLKQIYQIKDKDRSKLKIKRDQDVFQQNSKNHLRRVGSICRF